MDSGKAANEPDVQEMKLDLTRRMMMVNTVTPSGQAYFLTPFDAVKQFHVSAEGKGISYIGSLKTPPPLEVLKNRYEVLKEEFGEHGGIEHFGKMARGELACTLENIATLADWIADMEYLLKGLAVNLGIPHDTVFMLVHMANMRKTLRLGGPIFREDGKVMKPDGWVAPNKQIWQALQQQHTEDTKTNSHEHQPTQG